MEVGRRIEVIFNDDMDYFEVRDMIELCFFNRIF